MGKMLDIRAEHPATSTTFLTDSDKALAISKDSNPDDNPSPVSVSESTMSYKHVATWPLDEVGYKYVPAYTRPDCFSDAECCSWADALKAIEEHDWSLKGQDSRCHSPRNNAHRGEHGEHGEHGVRNSETTLKSLECLSIISVNSDEVQPDSVSASSLSHGAEHFDSVSTDEHSLSGPFTPENDTASERTQEIIAEVEPEDSYQSTTRTIDLQTASVTSSGHESLNSVPTTPVEDQTCHSSGTEGEQDLMLHGGDELQDHEEDQMPDVIEDEAAVGCSPPSELSVPQFQHSGDELRHELVLEVGPGEPAQVLIRTVALAGKVLLPLSESTDSPHTNATREDHDVAPSSEGEIYGITSATDTVATSIAENPANAATRLDENEQLSQPVNLAGETDIDKVDRQVSPVAEHDLIEQLQEAVVRNRKEVGDTQMEDAAEEFRGVSQPPPVIDDAGVEVKTIDFSTTSGENASEHGIVSPTEGPPDKIGSLQPKSCTLSDRSIQFSGFSETTVSPGSTHGDPPLLVDVSQRPMSDGDTPMQDADAGVTSTCSATEHQGVESSSPGLQLEEVASSNESGESHSPTDGSQHSTLPHATITELTETTPEPELPTSVTINRNFSITSAALAPSPPVIDISAIMAALATYMSKTTVSVLGLKRSYDCVEPVMDPEEGPATKKRRLNSDMKSTTEDNMITHDVNEDHSALDAVGHRSSSDVEPTTDNNMTTDDVVDEDHSAPDAAEQSSVEGMAVDEAYKQEEESAVSDTQGKANVETDTAVVGVQVTDGPVGTHFQAHVNGIATLSTYVPTEELPTGSAELAPPVMDVLDNTTKRDIEPQSPKSHECHLNSNFSPHFTGPYIQSADVEMQERLTTASVSPPPGPSTPNPTPVSKPCGPRIRFKPLRPAGDQEVTAKMEVLDLEAYGYDSDEAIQKQLAHEMTIDHSSGGDDGEVPTVSPHAESPAITIKPEDVSIPQIPTTDTTPTPTPTPQLTPPLLRELDLGYGRRTTRSQNHSTSASSSTPSKQRDGKLNGGDGEMKHAEEGGFKRTLSTPETSVPRSAATGKGSKRNKFGFRIIRARNGGGDEDASKEKGGVDMKKRHPRTYNTTPTTSISDPDSNPTCPPSSKKQGQSSPEIKRTTQSKSRSMSLPKLTKSSISKSSTGKGRAITGMGRKGNFTGVSSSKSSSEFSSKSKSKSKSSCLGVDKRLTRSSVATAAGARRGKEKKEEKKKEEEEE